MTASETDGAFQEIFLLGITKFGGTETQWAASVEEVTPEEGDKDGEGVAMGNGGRIWKRTPQDDSEFTLKIYPISVDVTDLNDLTQFFHGGTADTTAPIASTNTHGRDLFRVAMLMTDDPAAVAAGATTAINFAARRITFKDCRVTVNKDSWDDKMLSAEVKFKCPAFNKSAVGNITKESTLEADAAGLPALAAYS